MKKSIQFTKQEAEALGDKKSIDKQKSFENGTYTDESGKVHQGYWVEYESGKVVFIYAEE